MNENPKMRKLLFSFALLVFIFSLGSLISCSPDSEDDIIDGEQLIGNVRDTYLLSAGNNNMPSGGRITAEYADAPAGSKIQSIVDGDANTKYHTNHSSFSIIWNGTATIRLGSYSLTSAADAPEMDPKAWKLYASNDNKTWIELDAQTDQNFSSRKEEKVYEIDVATNYHYYKLSIVSNHGSAATQIAEWKLVVATPPDNIDDLIRSKGSNSTFSATHKMGTKHMSDLTATAEQLKWLADPAQEPGPIKDDQNREMRWKTFNVTSIYPKGDPVPSDVNQRAVGDCCACATLASFAYIYPGFIKNIIKDHLNQTWTVTLYDPQGKSISVGVSNFFIGNDTDGLRAVGGRNKEVTWATILEKALLKWLQVYHKNGAQRIWGIGTEYMAAIFTGDGESYAFLKGKLTASEMRRAVEVSLKQGRLVVGGFSKSDVQVDENWKTTALHAFTFILPDGDGSCLFKMRNPWGGKTDGVMKVNDDGKVPPLIDLRICAPGVAAPFGKGADLGGYIPNV